MKIIRERERVVSYTYSREYDWRDCPGAGFSFDSDKYGNIDIEELKKRPEAYENYQKCINGGHDVKLVGIRRYINRYTEPAVGICNNCGSEVELSCFTNTCEKCDTDYNMSGQELAPREQWGEETGEHWSECY